MRFDWRCSGPHCIDKCQSTPLLRWLPSLLSDWLAFVSAEDVDNELFSSDWIPSAGHSACGIWSIKRQNAVELLDFELLSRQWLYSMCHSSYFVQLLVDWYQLRSSSLYMLLSKHSVVHGYGRQTLQNINNSNVTHIFDASQFILFFRQIGWCCYFCSLLCGRK